MKKILYLSFFLCFGFVLKPADFVTTVLSTFESSYENVSPDFSIEEYNRNLFTANGEPAIYDNPDKSGLNTSNKCFGAINIADADWWGNIVCLHLNTPLSIPHDGDSYLQMKVYRSIQPKNFRVGINGREDEHEIYQGKLSRNAEWEQLKINLSAKKGQTIHSIYIVLSCNWGDPRSGWGEAAYYLDDIEFVTNGVVPPPGVVRINPSVTYQTVESFGASDCWMGNYTGRYWSDSAKEKIAKWLFSREQNADGNPEGIGLSMWRFNLGAGTEEQGANSGIEDLSRRTQCFLNPDGSYDWTKHAGQQYFLEKAKEYGCDQFVLFSNSPPVHMTKNGKGYSAGGVNGNLKDDGYTGFAEYMATVAEYFDRKKIPVRFISPVNEPQYEWKDGGQEGSPWTNADIKKLATELDRSLSKRNLRSKILLTEAGSWDYLYGNNGHANRQIYQFFDTGSSNYIGNLNSVEPVVGGHSYWTYANNATLTNVRTRVAEEAAKYGLKLYQTEWSMLGDPPQNAGFPADYNEASYMDIALFTAKIIHADLTIANVSSWSYWTSMDMERWGHKNRFLLIGLLPYDGVYGSVTDPRNSGADARSSLWALGNYSLFVRPGYKRIELSGADNPNGLMGSAYIASDNSKIVAVYVNMDKADYTLDMSVENQTATLLSVEKYVTSSNSNLKRDNRQTISDGVVQTVSIPNRSVTTVIFNYDASSGIAPVEKDKKDKTVMISPNPVKAGESVRLNFFGSQSGKFNILLYSLSGQLISQQFLHKDNHIQIPFGTSRGIYLIKIEGIDFHSIQKIIVR
ncbi:MAG: T9SS type A sorting domain-containing protein [Tannerella sp.]|jgi:O-glycosyl hydrolase|nr:T9SS type A sorting domain-containing protein [Tannerella sp.]